MATSTLRIALGAAAVVAPRLLLRPWVGAAMQGAGVEVLGRALGARDLALGVGAVNALRSGRDAAAWLDGAAVSDATDAVASLLSWSDLPPRSRAAVLAAATGGAIMSAGAARYLRRVQPRTFVP